MQDSSTDSQHWDVYAHLEDSVGVLSVSLGQWQDGRPRAYARHAANTAMSAIDDMLRELHQMRARLVGEIRVSDDDAAARADAMLAGVKAGGTS
jgi:hypothetical protein